MEGIVILKKSILHSSMIVVVYTKEVGKISFFIRGGRRYRKNYPSLDIFYKIAFDYLYSQDREGNIKFIMKEYTVENDYYKIRKLRDFRTLFILQQLLSIISIISAEYEPNTKIYYLITELLLYCYENSLNLIHRDFFLFSLLYFCGFIGDFATCSSCERHLIYEAYLNPFSIEVKCRSCNTLNSNVVKLNKRELNFFKEYHKKDFSTNLRTLLLSPSVCSILNQIIPIYYQLNFNIKLSLP